MPLLPMLLGATLVSIPLIGPLGAAISSTLLLGVGSAAAFALLAHKVQCALPTCHTGADEPSSRFCLRGWLEQPVCVADDWADAYP